MFQVIQNYGAALLTLTLDGDLCSLATRNSYNKARGKNELPVPPHLFSLLARLHAIFQKNCRAGSDEGSPLGVVSSSALPEA